MKNEESDNVQVYGLNVRCKQRADKNVNNRVNVAWSMWREPTRVICDRNIPTKLKDNVYKTALKPAVVYGADCWAVRKKERNIYKIQQDTNQFDWQPCRLDCHIHNTQYNTGITKNIYTYINKFKLV